MSRSERDNSLERDDDLPPLHPLLQIHEPPPPPEVAQESAAEPPRHALLEIDEPAAILQPPQPVTPLKSHAATPLLREPAAIEHQPEPHDVPEPHAVESALVAASAHAARPLAQAPSRRRWPRWVVAAVAIITLILVPLTWREAARIGAGGDLLQQWVRDRALPLPVAVVDPQQLDIRPRRAVRPGNFFGDGEYAYELWQPDAAGPRLVAKYLLVYTGGEFRLEAAFDATMQQRMPVKN